MKNWLLWAAILGGAYYFVTKANRGALRVISFDTTSGLAELSFAGQQIYLNRGEGVQLTDGRRVAFTNNQLLLYNVNAATPTVLR